MIKFPLFIPVKIAELGKGNVMWVENQYNKSKYFLALAVKPTQKTLESIGFDNFKQIDTQEDLINLYKNIIASNISDIEGVAIYSNEYQQFISLKAD
ncbi:hypothetical protein [Clostridium sp. YIM B02551]|uniref:hypothetical protein n=1 Tax=Clostridium sp. YIM B02551 TaxID=2910679 RepID=UPI001EEAC505|nr:hypothetical protein [Clostridium sp. YIM B02551]